MKSRQLHLVFVLLISFISVAELSANHIYACNGDSLKFYLDEYGNSGDFTWQDTIFIPYGDTIILYVDSIYQEFIWRTPDNLCNNSISSSIIVYEKGNYGFKWEGHAAGNFLVEHISPLSVKLGNYQFISDNMTIKLQVSEHLKSYIWSTGDSTSYIEISQPGIYWIKATSHCNDLFSDTITLQNIDHSYDNIYAGQDTGSYIMFFDQGGCYTVTSYSDFEYGGSPGSYDCNLDLNCDGITDFHYSYYHNVAIFGSWARYEIYPEDNCFVAVLSDGDNWAAALNKYEVIDQNLNWSNDTVILYKYSAYPGDCALERLGIWGNYTRDNQYLGLAVGGYITTSPYTYYCWLKFNHDTIDDYACRVKFQFPTSNFSINDINFKIFPNPVKNELIIQSKNMIGSDIKLMNMTGSTVYSGKIIMDYNRIDVSPFSKGIYIIRISDKENHYTEKIIIQ
ncbi:MAG: T9SS type A sorting domain-containing protein [Bacteroidales bacterium]|nr:T9SS type A sorting domain-containing protein [Bacteroidales bacterium]